MVLARELGIFAIFLYFLTHYWILHLRSSNSA